MADQESLWVFGECISYFLFDVPLKQAWVLSFVSMDLFLISDFYYLGKARGNARCLMLVKVFSWECNLLHILCTGLSLASIMTTFHFISAHFIGCGCVLCPTVVLEDLKESLKWRSLTSRNFQPVPFCQSSNFLYTYKNDFLMVASMYIFRWVCWSWQHYYILIAWCSCS